jgi:drug/metabolite transporter (DMT)-like permease
MALLLLVSFIWAFSFGLIKGRLAGVDPDAVATLRLALALAVFLPLLRLRGVNSGLTVRLVALGAVQFGLMYLLYQRAFIYLPAYAVVLFTLTMPLYVTLADAFVERRLQPRYLFAALLALLGAAIVVFNGSLRGNLLTGFALMQASNVCFATGQVAWRRLRLQFPAGATDASLFALPYAGALAASFLGSLITNDWAALHLTFTSVWVLVYLGVISSGLCFFWWNRGATQVNAGTLAVFNNAKVPLGVVCSLVFFHENADLPRLLASGALMALGVWIAERRLTAGGVT